MPLETGSVLSDLNAANPAHTDGLNNADAHIRLIKSTLLTTFPNINGVVTATEEQLNAAVSGTTEFSDGTSGAPSVSFASEPTLGFYRKAAGQIGIAKQLRGFGAKAPGEFEFWPVVPPNMASGGTFTGPASAVERIECDGSTYLKSDFPDVGALLGVDTLHFIVPNLTDTGRFIRSRTSGLAVGTAQANALKSHTHTGTTANAGSHTHTATVNDPGHAHTTPLVGANQGTSGGSNLLVTAGTGTTGTSTTNISVSNSTVADHNHTVTIAATGDTETRPEAYAAVVCVHT